MPDDTDILGLPLILPNQAQKHVTHNEALALLDVIVQLAVINRDQTVPPVLAVTGDRHIVAAGGTQDWAGKDGQIAVMTDVGWQFVVPQPGWRAHVLAEGETAVFDGLAWAVPSESAPEFAQLGINATADATNRLAVSSPAVLLNNAGAGVQLKLNKAVAGDTASLLFQTGFSGRAEMGTAGSDGFAVKVSADGNAWATALATDPASGEVTLPAPLHLGGQAADPASPADGTMWLNSTTGEVKLRTGGSTIAVGAGGGGAVADGDKGDITVSGGGTSWTLEDGVVTSAKLASSVWSDNQTVTGAWTFGDNANASNLFLTGAVGSGRSFYFRSAGSNRWRFITNGQAETGGNIGSNFSLQAFDDSGTFIGSAFDVTRATQVVNFNQEFTIGGKALGEAIDDRVAALLVAGTNVTLNYDDAAGTLTVNAAAGGSLTDGDKGDITVSGSGASWTVDAGVISNAKLVSMGSGLIKGRIAAGSGAVQDLTADEVREVLGLGPLAPGEFWTVARFASTAAMTQPFAGGAISSGTISSAVPGTALTGINSYGTFIRSSTSANAGYRFVTRANSDFFGVQARKFRGVMMWRNATGTTVRLGFHNCTTVADTDNGAYFEVLGNVISAKTAVSSGRTTHPTTYALSVNALYTFEIDVDAPATGARFRVWEDMATTPVLDVTIATTLPTSNATPFGAGMVATESSTTASDIAVVYELGFGTVAAFRRMQG